MNGSFNPDVILIALILGGLCVALIWLNENGRLK